MTRARVPAIEGWFTTDDEPRLLGARGVESGSYFFPPRLAVSANPATPFEERVETPLSRRGRVWSYTTNHYAPPPPYVAPDPFVPYTVLAVELEEEQMVVLGLLDDGADPGGVTIGTEVELVLGTLFADEEQDHLVWKWRPVTGRTEVEGGGAA